MILSQKKYTDICLQNFYPNTIVVSGYPDIRIFVYIPTLYTLIRINPIMKLNNNYIMIYLIGFENTTTKWLSDRESNKMRQGWGEGRIQHIMVNAKVFR